MNCLIFIENSRSINPLDTPQEIMKLVAQLPFRMRDAWRRRAHDLMVQRDAMMFTDPVQFVERELSILKQPVFGCLSTDVTTTSAKQKSGKVKRSLATRVESEYQQSTVEKAEQTPENYGKLFCEFCKFTNHYISYCHKFGKLPIKERIEFVKKAKLCYSCLRKSRVSKNCPKKSVCFHCKKSHPSMLHNTERETAENAHDSKADVNSNQNQSENKTVTLISARSNVKDGRRVVTPTIPAKLKIKGLESRIIVNCALDSCSSDCWIREDIVSQLGVKF